MEPRLQISGDHDHKLESQFLQGFRIVEILKNTDQASCKTPVTKGKKLLKLELLVVGYLNHIYWSALLYPIYGYSGGITLRNFLDNDQSAIINFPRRWSNVTRTSCDEFMFHDILLLEICRCNYAPEFFMLLNLLFNFGFIWTMKLYFKIVFVNLKCISRFLVITCYNVIQF